MYCVCLSLDLTSSRYSALGMAISATHWSSIKRPIYCTCSIYVLHTVGCTPFAYSTASVSVELEMRFCAKVKRKQTGGRKHEKEDNNDDLNDAERLEKCRNFKTLILTELLHFGITSPEGWH